jgi:hypothetical protein
MGILKRTQLGKAQVSYITRTVKERAQLAVRDVDFQDVFAKMGTQEVDESAGAALRVAIAEMAAEYAIEAMAVARKRRIRLGAAAVILATRRGRRVRILPI